MRFPDWPKRLDAAIAAARHRNFVYGGLNGAQDCALFAADCVQAITGVDYAAELRGYDSKVAAYRIVAAYGSLEAMIAALLKREPVHRSQARRGDVVLAEIELGSGESGECVGICAGAKFLFPKSVVGLRSHAIDAVRLAWRVD